jgi:excinuclease ABC subunit C
MIPDKILQQTLKNLPKKPGVYRYLSDNNDVLYIGKAKNLKNRVSTYFQQNRQRNERLNLMVSQIDKIEYTIVDSEEESLILEANLINNLQPKYNIKLKDDSSYVYLRFTTDPISTIQITRHKYDPNSLYFGPYTKKSGIYDTIQTIRTVFPFCQAKKPQKTPCNYYQIKQCEGICAGIESLDNYKSKLDQIKNILKGNITLPEKYLTDKILSATKESNFQLAALYRDKLKTLKETISDQKIILPNPQDIDLISLVINNDLDNNITSVFVQNIRGGKIINLNNFILSGNINEEESIEFQYLRTFLHGYFDKKTDLVEVLVHIYKKESEEYKKLEITTNNLDLIRKSLKIKITQRNNYKTNKEKIRELMESSKQNAIIYLERNKLGQKLTIFEENNLFKTIVELQNKLHLNKIPRRIECYDISHISGKFVYGSMVVFNDGRASKKDYRLFKTTEQNNDFANHQEVLERRFKRCLEWELQNSNSDQKNPWKLPDLIIVDGGKGQLSADLFVLNNYKKKFKQAGLKFEIEICALAKKDEEIFLPNTDRIIILENQSKFLVQRIRDEAHRFAITNNRKARLSTIRKSEIDNIPGIGPKTKQKLLVTFGSTKNIIDNVYQNPELINELVGEKILIKIKNHFRII